MAARKIMIIRHAEKPDEQGTLFGVDAQGNPDSNELVVRGWQRAGALVRFFAPLDGRFRDASIETPDVVFATALGPRTKSWRPQHTVGPLVEVLGRERLNLDFTEGKEAGLLGAAKAAGDVVLISWHRTVIPDIKDAILGDQSPPRKWPKERFDLVWVFTRLPGGEWRFEQAPQLLLPGDKPDPIA